MSLDVLGRSCATLAEPTSYLLRDQHHGLVCLWIGPRVLSYKVLAPAWNTFYNVPYLRVSRKRSTVRGYLECRPARDTTHGHHSAVTVMSLSCTFVLKTAAHA
jgi:hypothetical protein